MNLYRIKYKHGDMSDDYVGKTDKWAHDEKTAVGYLCKARPDKLGVCKSKKGARLTILSVEEIPPNSL